MKSHYLSQISKDLIIKTKLVDIYKQLQCQVTYIDNNGKLTYNSLLVLLQKTKLEQINCRLKSSDVSLPTAIIV